MTPGRSQALATSNFRDWHTVVGEIPCSSAPKTMDCYSKNREYFMPLVQGSLRMTPSELRHDICNAMSSIIVFIINLVNLLSRPTYLSANLGFTAILSIFFFRALTSELAERNSTKTGHMLGSECDLKMCPKYPFPYKSGPQNHLFSTTSQLNGTSATLTVYIFGTKHDIGLYIIGQCVANYTRALLHSLKTT